MGRDVWCSHPSLAEVMETAIAGRHGRCLMGLQERWRLNTSDVDEIHPAVEAEGRVRILE
jgi:hypothetical protein